MGKKETLRDVGDGFQQVLKKQSKKKKNADADVEAIASKITLLKIDNSKDMVEEVLIDEATDNQLDSTAPTTPDALSTNGSSYPVFESVSEGAAAISVTGIAPNPKSVVTLRRIVVPKNRMKPLQSKWTDLIQPLVVHMKLQVRFNTKRKCIEMRPSPNRNVDKSAIEKSCEYVKAFLLGFELHDAIALLRLDNIFLQSFQVSDVKRLVNQNMSRAIGRIAGKDGKTKFAIENSTKTRIVIADKNIHLLGSYENIILARDSICSLILGSPPSKVYNHLRIVSRRMKERA